MMDNLLLKTIADEAAKNTQSSCPVVKAARAAAVTQLYGRARRLEDLATRMQIMLVLVQDMDIPGLQRKLGPEIRVTLHLIKQELGFPQIIGRTPKPTD